MVMVLFSGLYKYAHYNISCFSHPKSWRMTHFRLFSVISGAFVIEMYYPMPFA